MPWYLEGSFSLVLAALRIQRMPPETVEFDDPAEYPYMAVASPSSHDTPTLRAWYEEDGERQKRFRSFLEERGFLASNCANETTFHETAVACTNKSDQMSVELCTPEIAMAVVKQHLEAPCVLSIFPLQDLMAISPSLSTRPAQEESINDPSNSEHYWRYRMHITLEELQKEENLNCLLKDVVSASGRNSS